MLHKWSFLPCLPRGRTLIAIDAKRRKRYNRAMITSRATFFSYYTPSP